MIHTQHTVFINLISACYSVSVCFKVMFSLRLCRRNFYVMYSISHPPITVHNVQCRYSIEKLREIKKEWCVYDSRDVYCVAPQRSFHVPFIRSDGPIQTFWPMDTSTHEHFVPVSQLTPHQGAMYCRSDATSQAAPGNHKRFLAEPWLFVFAKCHRPRIFVGRSVTQLEHLDLTVTRTYWRMERTPRRRTLLLWMFEKMMCLVFVPKSLCKIWLALSSGAKLAISLIFALTGPSVILLCINRYTCGGGGLLQHCRSLNPIFYCLFKLQVPIASRSNLTLKWWHS